MKFHEVVCSYLNKKEIIACQVLIKIEKFENDKLVPAMIKWEVDQLLIHHGPAEVLNEPLEKVEPWILDMCRRTWSGRPVEVKTYLLHE